jgi:hypothetical protein
VTLHQLSQVGVFIYSSHGKWVFPPLLWSFPPTATSTSFPAPGCWACAATPAFASCPPSSSVLRAPCPLCYMSFLLLLLIIQFFFFSPCGSVCPGGYADLAQDGLWKYRILLTLWPASSQAVWVLPSGVGMGALLVSPFNVKWGCYVHAGGVEESQFCLFLVVFPVRCISSVSPRFYFNRHAFCFLPVAAILESPTKSRF